MRKKPSRDYDVAEVVRVLQFGRIWYHSVGGLATSWDRGRAFAMGARRFRSRDLGSWCRGRGAVGPLFLGVYFTVPSDEEVFPNSERKLAGFVEAEELVPEVNAGGFTIADGVVSALSREASCGGRDLGGDSHRPSGVPSDVPASSSLSMPRTLPFWSFGGTGRGNRRSGSGRSSRYLGATSVSLGCP